MQDWPEKVIYSGLLVGFLSHPSDSMYVLLHSVIGHNQILIVHAQVGYTPWFGLYAPHNISRLHAALDSVNHATLHSELQLAPPQCVYRLRCVCVLYTPTNYIHYKAHLKTTIKMYKG